MIEASPNVSVEELITPIPGGNPAGVDIAYDEDFTLLRSKRNVEDEHTLGIWQVLETPDTLSKADKRSIYDICVNILKNKSKNLQICAFLLEDIVKKNNMEGIELGLDLLYKLINQYWDSLYPIDGTNLLLDERKKIFEWIDEKCSFALKISFLLKGKIKEDICFDDIEKINRMGHYSTLQPMPVTAEKEKKYNFFISQLSVDLIQTKILDPVNRLFTQINQIKTLLNSKMNDEDFYLPLLIHTLEDIQSFFSYRLTTLQLNTTPAKPNTETQGQQENHEEPVLQGKEINKEENLTAVHSHSREALYKEIYDLVTKLKEIDLHSPVPDLILKALSWKDLSFVQITEELDLNSSLLSFLKK